MSLCGFLKTRIMKKQSLVIAIAVCAFLISCGEKRSDSSKNDSAASTSNSASGTDTNFIDAKGLRQGWWVIFGRMVPEKGFPPNAKIEEGKYVDGKREGLWQEYFPNGAVKYKGEYLHDRKTGKWGEYDEQGKETGEVIYN